MTESCGRDNPTSGCYRQVDSDLSQAWRCSLRYIYHPALRDRGRGYLQCRRHNEVDIADVDGVISKGINIGITRVYNAYKR